MNPVHDGLPVSDYGYSVAVVEQMPRVRPFRLDPTPSMKSVADAVRDREFEKF
jgi:hypothetical protein